jgi:hypothetical protein
VRSRKSQCIEHCPQRDLGAAESRNPDVALLLASGAQAIGKPDDFGVCRRIRELIVAFLEYGVQPADALGQELLHER